jgi:hypothetical protein
MVEPEDALFYKSKELTESREINREQLFSATELGCAGIAAGSFLGVTQGGFSAVRGGSRYRPPALFFSSKIVGRSIGGGFVGAIGGGFFSWFTTYVAQETRNYRRARNRS